ncbi:hypothetical protein [Deinococcus marmoris]|uniref:hypothetical protein n=1 Tax=Deinococcus marmoris TaxID=249408 RepID=UPI000B0A00E3|nr:hypothetical protein [Deinococcus marmoris]
MHWPADLEAMRVHWPTRDGQALDVRPVFLYPTLEVTQARVGKAFDTLSLVPMTASIHPSMPAAEDLAAGWRVLDTSNLGPGI